MNILYGMFCGKTRPGIEKILVAALGQLSAQLGLPGPLKRYLDGSLPQIAAAIENAVMFKTLDHVFVLPKYPQNNPKTVFSFGEQMDDEKYRQVLEEIRRCRYLADKKALIKSEVHSLADLEDILLDAEPCEVEIISILGELSPIEIAALVKKHPVSAPLEQFELRENQIALHQGLQKFIASLPVEKRSFINRAAGVLDLDEDL